ncbi:MAG: hypothetical protein V4476_03880 [Pseudomonadota bacterium]
MSMFPFYKNAVFRITPRDTALMRDLRYILGENQTQFWQRFGVSQSCGSRFERGGTIPFPVLMLTRLHLLEIINDDDLERVNSPNFENEVEVTQAPQERSGPHRLPLLR